MATDGKPQTLETESLGREDAGRILHRKLARARWTLAWEALWPALLAPLCVIGLFLAVSWTGFWLVSPKSVRLAGICVFLALLVWSLRDLFRFRVPDSPAAGARLDRDSGITHRPVTASADTLAAGANDPFARELWRRHQEAARARLAAIRVAAPDPQARRRDPRALRAGILVALLATAWLAGPERQARIEAAFAFTDPPPPPVPTRLDAWVDTPPYTGRPPIFLTRETAADTAEPAPIAVPEKSVLVLRASPATDVEIIADGKLQPKPDSDKRTGEAVERRFVVAGTGTVVVRQHGSAVARFALNAIPDHAPTIRLAGRPERGEHDSLRVRYRGEDDYGIAGVEARFAPVMPAGRPAPRSLVPPPSVGLPLPGREGDADTEGTIELGEHPWAGARVAMTLVARDDAGQEGHSETVEVTIPQRVFTDPLAKALVEQRRNLIVDPDHHEPVQVALDALLIAPELFTRNLGTFIALRTASTQLQGAKTDQDLLGVADWLWKIALELEDGGLSDAEKALREAQERLKDALDRNASPDEIKRLTQDLQRAMNQYMREMAERAQRDPNRTTENDDGRERRTITQQDLRRMAQEIERLAREGKHAEAQRLLEQLNRMMENMRVARNRQNTDPRQRQMGDALDELDQMTREQRDLRDRTFRDGQNGQQSQPNQNRRNQQGQRQQGQRQQGQQGQRQRGQPGQQGEGDDQQQGQGQGTQELRDRQQALREQLNRMRERMRQGGVGEQQELSEAEQEMQDAEGALGRGDNGSAVDSQGRALDKLQKGGRQLAEQMMRENGDGTEQADGEDGGDGSPDRYGNRQGGDRRFGDAGRESDRDPLGRSRRGQLNPDSRFDDKFGLGPGERANRILEELRRRLGQTGRPPLELDYLDRLLRKDQ